MTKLLQRPSELPLFAKAFFTHAERVGVTTVLLHGWKDGFAGKLSDIDFVMDEAGFRGFPGFVKEHCARHHWKLVQVLRHETSAAYAVCVNPEEPTQVVALDACSDYQRNGMFFLQAEEMLAGAERLPWGGFRVSDGINALYRVSKAAAKGKPAASLIDESKEWTEQVKTFAAAEMQKRWKASPGDWSEQAIERALIDIRNASDIGFTKYRPAEIWRRCRRMLHPTGLMLFMPESGLDMIRLGQVLSPMFRRVKICPKPSIRDLFHLVQSGLLLCHGCRRPVGIPSRMAISLPQDSTMDEAMRLSIDCLEARCSRRESFTEH